VESAASIEEPGGLVGVDVVDALGRSVGNVEEVFADPETRRPEWIGVVRGLFVRRRVIVPAMGLERAGGLLQVPWTRDRVRRAPRYGAEDRGGILGLGSYSPVLAADKQRAAAAHYGIEPDEVSGGEAPR
jgi:hypothetical protein